MNRGFTILETMVAISLFIVVVMYGMGTLLSANALYKKTQDLRSILDNLSFAMEDMSRNLRTGYNYHCIDNGDFTVGALNSPRRCSSGGGIAFEEAITGSASNQNDQWVYKIESTDGGATYNISKSIDTGATWVRLTPEEVKLSSVSSFAVLGPAPPPGNFQQPFVTIRLVGTITTNNVVTPFSLQTSVSQRLIDVAP